MKKKIVYIAPHLSTGGLPQYLFKQIESINDTVDVYCIEWENVTGGVLVIQRNRILNLLGKNLITLGENKLQLIEILQNIQPDVVHLQEIPEMFMPEDVADKLYSMDREYVIVETSHDSSFDINKKTYLPDKFLMVSQYQINDYRRLGIPCALVEYPIEYKTRTKAREEALRSLGLDPNVKHVINVGLFTPRKNQAEIIEYAKMLKNYPIQFHFLGNHADNFKFYWEPLMKEFPSNCTWWNERDDVDAFYEAADLLLFTSRGSNTDKETMPLVIREALSWKVPSLIYNLPVYLNYFDKFDTISYLNFESLSENADRILQKLNLEKSSNTEYKPCMIISSYPNTQILDSLTKECVQYAKAFGMPIILTTHCNVSSELREMVDHHIMDPNNLLTRHTYYNRYWHKSDKIHVEFSLKKEDNDVYHGPAVHRNYYNGIKLANTLGYTHAFCFNFDMLLKDRKPVEAISEALTHHRGHMVLSTSEEGNVLRTSWFVTEIGLFLDRFPNIDTEEEYNNWYTSIGSESNGLENMYYHTLKNDLHEIKIITTDEFLDMHKENDIDLCSRSEYSIVLPVENHPELVAIWFSSRNILDNRQVKIYVNGKFVETVHIDNHTIYYKFVDINHLREVKYEWEDANSVISSKIISVNDEYKKETLHQNGWFRIIDESFNINDYTIEG